MRSRRSAALSDYLPGDRRRLSDDDPRREGDGRVLARSLRLGRRGYDDGDCGRGDPAAAANAAFRESQRDPAVGPAAVQRLDGVLQAYASALKASPQRTSRRPTTTNTSRAFAIRWRDRRRDASRRAPAAAGPVMGGDLPAGATIHGGPGAPPPDAKMEELQTIAPMEYGDREAQPEATPGAKRERKG